MRSLFALWCWALVWIVQEVQRIRDDAKIHFRQGQYHIAKKVTIMP
jgi:hypothetical protein